MPVQSYEELRQAALKMQVAVGNVLAHGGIDLDKWWGELIEAQQHIATITHGTSAEFNKYRKPE
jgi:hypothetical protein